jgi:hypothetical protein
LYTKALLPYLKGEPEVSVYDTFIRASDDVEDKLSQLNGVVGVGSSKARDQFEPRRAMEPHGVDGTPAEFVRRCYIRNILYCMHLQNGLPSSMLLLRYFLYATHMRGEDVHRRRIISVQGLEGALQVPRKAQWHSRRRTHELLLQRKKLVCTTQTHIL